jgi:subtilisin family serine protease
MTHQIQGVAPRCRLLSLKVMNADGKGRESLILAALDYVSRVNDDGRWQRIHGVNLSLGYTFNAEWFAAGHSPICVAVNRLVRMGVVVVAAAGNDGSAIIETELGGRKRIGLDQSIADPGNAEGAITVGSTHPEQPHTYGISYFSSRGPTADGRPKPDLVAPGERILSCASPASLQRMALDDAPLQAALGQAAQGQVFYREETGTSMAAPHVSGAVAAFLSVRPEFKGQPERIKEILMASATDLRRKADFQGAGLLDLLRAIQSV